MKDYKDPRTYRGTKKLYYWIKTDLSPYSFYKRRLLIAFFYLRAGYKRDGAKLRPIKDYIGINLEIYYKDNKYKI